MQIHGLHALKRGRVRYNKTRKERRDTKEPPRQLRFYVRNTKRKEAVEEVTKRTRTPYYVVKTARGIFLMKIVVVKSPKFFVPLLKRIFKIGKKE